MCASDKCCCYSGGSGYSVTDSVAAGVASAAVSVGIRAALALGVLAGAVVAVETAVRVAVALLPYVLAGAAVTAASMVVMVRLVRRRCLRLGPAFTTAELAIMAQNRDFARQLRAEQVRRAALPAPARLAIEAPKPDLPQVNLESLQRRAIGAQRRAMAAQHDEGGAR